MSTITAPSRLTPTDQARRVVVVLAQVFCILGTLVGIGVFGARVEESSGGALAADATLIAPAGPAFSIWTVIYIGLAAYTVWQFLPRNAVSERTRATGWLAAASMVLNAVWLLVTQQGWIWVSVVVILTLAVVLGLLVRALTRRAPASTLERVVVDGTFGLYLGWVAVATCANVTAAAESSGADLGPAGAQWAAVGVLVVATGLGIVLALTLGARWAVAAASAWGLAWIAVGRLTDEPRSGLVGVAAILAALVVLAVTGWLRTRSTSRRRV
jgi:hypothetical protein